MSLQRKGGLLGVVDGYIVIGRWQIRSGIFSTWFRMFMRSSILVVLHLIGNKVYMVRAAGADMQYCTSRPPLAHPAAFNGLLRN